MICKSCGYAMDAFDKECLRCHGKGVGAPSTPVTAQPQSTPATPTPQQVPQQAPQQAAPQVVYLGGVSPELAAHNRRVLAWVLGLCFGIPALFILAFLVTVLISAILR